MDVIGGSECRGDAITATMRIARAAVARARGDLTARQREPGTAAWRGTAVNEGRDGAEEEALFAAIAAVSTAADGGSGTATGGATGSSEMGF